MERPKSLLAMMADGFPHPRHGEKLLENLENMRKSQVACDFEIRVGKETFPVHRTVLIGSSTYFERLFESNMREVTDGYIVMENVSALGILHCMQSIYTGKVWITSQNVKDILEASHLFWLEDLVAICLQYLRDHLSLESWLMTSRLFQLYGSQDDLSNTEQYVASNFVQVIRQTDFLEITEAELGRFMDHSNRSAEVHWEVIITWIQGDITEREKYLPRLIGYLFKRWFSLRFLINNILVHHLVQKSDEAKFLLILETLSRYGATFKKELDTEMCLELKEHIKKTKISVDIVNLDSTLQNCLARELEQAIKNKKFLSLSLKEVTDIILIARCNSKETVKWETILKWVRHEESRSDNLPELMKLLDFKKIPARYILHSIRPEPLVVRSPRCSGILREAANFCIAPHTLVKLDSGSGILTTFDVENGHQSEIKNFAKTGFTAIVSLRGNIYLLQNKNLYRYSKTGNWTEQATLLSKPSKSSQMVTFQDKIYVIEKRKMSRYNLSKDIWSEVLPGCGLNVGFCAAASENFIFTIGGVFSWRTAERFDSEYKKWSMIAAPKDGRRGAAAVTFGGKLYVLGGSAPKINKTNVECYNERTNQWSDVASMQRPRAWFTAIMYKDGLYAVGGYPDRGSIEVYRKDTKCWEEKREMATPEGDISLCVCTL